MINAEAEMSILGSVLYDPSLMDSIPTITPEHFTSPDRASIFATMSTMHAVGETIDSVTLRNANAAVTPEMINYLADLYYTAINIGKYAGIVKECAKRRELMQAIDDAKQKVISTPNFKEAIDAVEASILSVRGESHSSTSAGISHLLKTAFSDIEERYNNRGQITGLATNYHDLDAKLCGFQNGDLILLAARPSMGKTAFALNVAENVCINGKSVQFFSLEMSGSQLVQRNLASIGRVNSQRMRTGNFEDVDFARMSVAAEKIHKWKMQIEEGFSVSLLDIRAAARKQKRSKDGLDLIVIDYLQLIDSHKKEFSREQEIAKMSRSLKMLAKELEVPVVVLAQLNRDLEKRENKRPVNSDLRESGSLEQDADVILFLHREAYFCPKCRSDDEVCGENHYNEAELIISKQRNGPTGTCKLVWFGEICRFENTQSKGGY